MGVMKRKETNIDQDLETDKISESLLDFKNAVIFDHNQPILKETKNEEIRYLPIMPNVIVFF